jgi:hypothetical protein
MAEEEPLEVMEGWGDFCIIRVRLISRPHVAILTCTCVARMTFLPAHHSRHSSYTYIHYCVIMHAIRFTSTMPAFFIVKTKPNQTNLDEWEIFCAVAATWACERLLVSSKILSTHFTGHSLCNTLCAAKSYQINLPRVLHTSANRMPSGSR